MLLGFDHLIVAANDIAEADRNYRRAGFEVTHRPDAGISETAIRIICFDDGSYLELFSFREPGRPSAHRWASLVPRGEGWIDWALWCDDVQAEADRLKQHDLPHAGPRTGGKSLLDGRAWKVGVVEAGYGVGNPLMPFFIQDLAERQIRVPRPHGAPPQAGGTPGIAGITELTRDLANSVGQLSRVLGPGVAVSARLPGASAAHLFPIAGGWMELVEATGGELADHIETHGEGIWEVTLGPRPATRPGDGALLPTGLTHGARLRVVQ
jgi:hypothetical protein